MGLCLQEIPRSLRARNMYAEMLSAKLPLRSGSSTNATVARSCIGSGRRLIAALSGEKGSTITVRIRACRLTKEWKKILIGKAEDISLRMGTSAYGFRYRPTGGIGFSSTVWSWKRSWAENFFRPRQCITSMASNRIIVLKTWNCGSTGMGRVKGKAI